MSEEKSEILSGDDVYQSFFGSPMAPSGKTEGEQGSNPSDEPEKPPTPPITPKEPKGVIDTGKDGKPVDGTQTPPLTDESKKDEGKVTPSFDFASAFGEKFKSPEDIKGVLSHYEEVVRENEQLKTKEPGVQTPFVNDMVYRMNAHLGNGIDPGLAYRLSSLTEDKLKEMSDIDVLVLKELIETPQYIDIEDTLSEDLKEKYNTSIVETDEDGDPLPETDIAKAKRIAQRNEISRIKDAAKAREELKNVISVEMPQGQTIETQKAATQAEIKHFSEQWGFISKEMAEKSFAEVPIPDGVPEKEGEAPKVLTTFKLSPEKLAKLPEMIQDIALKNNKPLTEAGVREVLKEAYYNVLGDNFPQVMESVKSFYADKAKKEMEEKYAGVPPSGEIRKPTEEEITHEQQILQQQEELFPTHRKRG